MTKKFKEGERHIGTIEFTPQRDAIIIIENKRFFIYRSNTKNSLNQDTVEIELFLKNKKIEAKVVNIVKRFRTTFVGKIIFNEKTTFVQLDSKKIFTDFWIRERPEDVKNGQKVAIELLAWDEHMKSPSAKIIKVLGDEFENETEMNAIMYEYGLPIEFPISVEEESEMIPVEISEYEISKRKDMRNVTTFTIDPNDAKDFDDALSVEFKDGGNIEIGVHIADVSYYIKPDSELDIEANNRGTSVYLVDRCVPMLPEKLSNGVCSLRPNEDKLCFSVIYTMDVNGGILNEWIGRTIIHSDKRYAYEDAQNIIEGSDDIYMKEVLLLDKFAKQYRNQRIKNGSLDMGGEEVKFNLDPITKKPTGVYFKVQKDSNKLIEEYMLMANKTVGKYLSKQKVDSIYRLHEKPTDEKLEQLAKICNAFKHDINFETEKELKSNLNKLIIDIKDTPEENMIKTLIVRSMQKAKYGTINIGHFGLEFTHYSHFTSPIRRYSDCILHRVLEYNLPNGGYQLTHNKQKTYNKGEIDVICEHINKTEMSAAKAERDSIKYKQIEYLMSLDEKKFDGIITGITEWGTYVEISDNKCEGMCRYEDFMSKWYPHPDEFLLCDDIGNILRLGDEVSIRIKSLDLEKRQINFYMLK